MDDRELLMKISADIAVVKRDVCNSNELLEKQHSQFQRALDDHENRLRALEGEPGTRWRHMVTTIIGTITGAVVGALATLLLR